MSQQTCLLTVQDERKMKKNIVRAANLSLHSATRQIGRALTFRSSSHGKPHEVDRIPASSHSFLQKGFAELNDDSESASSISFANDSAEVATMSVSSSCSESEPDREHVAGNLDHPKSHVSTKLVVPQNHSARAGEQKDSPGGDKNASKELSDHESNEMTATTDRRVEVASTEEQNYGKNLVRRRRQKAPTRRKSDPDCLVGISQALGDGVSNESGRDTVLGEVSRHDCSVRSSERVQSAAENLSAAGPRRHRAPRRLRSDPSSLHGISRHAGEETLTTEGGALQFHADGPNQKCHVVGRRRSRTLHRRKSDSECLVGVSRHVSEKNSRPCHDGEFE